MNELEQQQQAALREAMDILGVHQAPKDFKANVMDAILKQDMTVAPAIVYEPIISKKGWWLIAASIAVVLTVFYFYPSSLAVSDTYAFLAEEFTLPSYDLPKLSFKTPTYLVLGFITVAIFLSIQMPLLRRFYDRG